MPSAPRPWLLAGLRTWCSCWRAWVLILPPQWIATPGTQLAYYRHLWQPVHRFLPAGVDVAALPHATAVFNVIAFLAIAVVTTILVIGIQESATINTVIVFIKVGHGVGVHRHRCRLSFWNHCHRPKPTGRPSFLPIPGVTWRVRMVGRDARRRAKFSSPTLDSMPFQPPLRRPRIRKRTCLWAF